MDSQSLNDRLSALDTSPLANAFEFQKPIFYIGWYWRTVDFDAETCTFGVVPPGTDGNCTPLVGFMENNKWGYPTVRATEPQWTEIKALLIAAAENPSKETCDAVNAAMQKLADGRDFLDDL